MDSSGNIYEINSEEERKEIEKANGKLLPISEQAAKRLAELPSEMRKAFYDTMFPKAESIKSKFNKEKNRKKNKLARIARKKNRK